MREEEKTAILESLAKNEEKLSELYALYAEKFKGMRTFWFVLSGEEINHSQWIRHLGNPALSGDIYLDQKTFNPQSISLFAGYLSDKIAEAKARDLPLLTALGIALDIENALIEKRWFESIQTDSAAAKIDIDRLKDALIKHKAKVIEALEEARRSSL